MTKISTPESIHNPPTLPLPWRPSERAEIMQRLVMDKRNNTAELLDYWRDATSQYIITDIGVQAVQSAVGFMSVGEEVFGKTYCVDMPAYDMQREFEQDVIGLKPLDNNDGLRHFEARASFGGGYYPIEPFADFAGADTDDFRDILMDRQMVKFGHVIVRSAGYIVPVKLYGDSQSTVCADRAVKLSDIGNALVDTAISIADYSTRAS